MRNDLNEIARQHSADMTLGLVSFGHSGFKDRFKMAINIIKTIRSFEENVAYAATTWKDVAEMWENSRIIASIF